MSQNDYYRASDKKKGVFKHHGIALMKWGERRYQNEDGTWTQEGLERRRAMYEASKPSGFRKMARKANLIGAVGSEAFTVPAGMPIVSTREIKDRTIKIDETLKDTKSPIYTDDLTNKELKDMIDRLTLEKNYKDLLKKDIDSGRDTVKDVLEIVGNLAVTGAAVVLAAQAIKKLKKG